MQLAIFQLNSFTQKPFSGNPAAVVPLRFWLPDEVMLGIARENNLSETAFYVSEPEGLRIRWFTPGGEVKLCGHATLATGRVWFDHNPDSDSVVFNSLSGPLKVLRQDDRTLTLDFPSRPGEPCDPPQHLEKALGVDMLECFRSVEDLMVVVKDESTVLSVAPDFSLLSEVDSRGTIVTAKGRESDFVSRFFAPKFGINEDPVTGSAHTVLAPYWAERLGKPKLSAVQRSARGGELTCELTPENRVLISGYCQPYMAGNIEIEI